MPNFSASSNNGYYFKYLILISSCKDKNIGAELYFEAIIYARLLIKHLKKILILFFSYYEHDSYLFKNLENTEIMQKKKVFPNRIIQCKLLLINEIAYQFFSTCVFMSVHMMSVCTHTHIYTYLICR